MYIPISKLVESRDVEYYDQTPTICSTNLLEISTSLQKVHKI